MIFDLPDHKALSKEASDLAEWLILKPSLVITSTPNDPEMRQWLQDRMHELPPPQWRRLIEGEWVPPKKGMEGVRKSFFSQWLEASPFEEVANEIKWDNEEDADDKTDT